ncbi:MAG: class I SAM-dependent methyltransferase, partial [bacterium]
DGSVLFQHRTAGGGAQERFGLGAYKALQHFQYDKLCQDWLEELRGHLPFYEALSGRYPERVSPHRRNGYAALFNAAEERGLKRIVETGTLRQKDNWHGDGGFTWWAGAYAAKVGGAVDTVDIAPEALAVAKEVCAEWGEYIRYRAADSVEYLTANTEPVDVLFLDSVDYDADSCFKAQDHNWREVSAALPHLHEKSLIAFDDATIAGGGKGGVSIPRLEQTGWTVIHKDYVTVMARKAT